MVSETAAGGARMDSRAEASRLANRHSLHQSSFIEDRDRNFAIMNRIPIRLRARKLLNSFGVTYVNENDDQDD